MLRQEYTYKDYKIDFDQLIESMVHEEEAAKIESCIDNTTFLQEMCCIKALSVAWGEMAKINSSLDLIKAATQLGKVYETNKFSTGDYFPNIVGDRTLHLGKCYLALLNKSLTISIPKIGNIITQPIIDMAIISEKKDTQRCILELENTITEYLNKVIFKNQI